ncbi:hypothetical protein GTP06_13710 [Lactococcus lactis]|uniref:hypothetical protein n=1 Tax=Lactococcus lactis TaxID=1358 RepID=UPI0013C9120F|nr:hypothetical protein [Lactococcus lactis]NEX59322.1 hypothetical protein [Lactococcus lactis]
MSKLKHELRILRDENQKLRNTLEISRRQEDIYISTLVEIMNLSSLSPVINDIARKTLFGLRERGCPAGPIGVLGLKKEEIKENENE